MEYCLLDIGVRKDTGKETTSPASVSTLDSEAEESTKPVCFNYECQTYIQLDPQLQLNMILRNVRRVPEYELRERTDACDSSSIILGVFLRMLRPGEIFDNSCLTQRQRLITLLFKETHRQSFIEQELEVTQADEESVLSVTQFYEALRSRHQTQESENATLPDTIAHPFLRPQLRPYQQHAIRWMINRESAPGTLPAQYVRLRSEMIPEVDFFMDPYSYFLTDSEPPPIALPAGGILADEMGMGKTVEILGLLLLNRRPDGETPDLMIGKADHSESSDEEEAAELRCLCVKKHRKDIVACRKCGRVQHRKCVGKHIPNKTASWARYLCPECWRTEPLVESKTTIIVSPPSIKYQWHSEIEKHVSDPNFRVFVYNGVSETNGGWISPADLATYDVVLTDYNVLRPEIYLVAENARASRHEKRFLSPVTPLTMVRWWRVCLDEAQMVEGVDNNATKMVKSLPAIHRWTVTGTPIEKTINNLYGLVHFLDYAPYSSFPIWKQYASRFQWGNAEPLLQAMVRVMWRTCKNAVLDQLGIPPQTERVHYITMSDLQSYFYRNEHMNCAQAFHEKAQTIGRDLSMAQMNVQTLNQLMEPLRKLRQDCTVPSILYAGNSLPVKKLLTPAELHEYLKGCNFSECKIQLRSIASSLNGMAAVHIMQKDYNQALRFYQSSLRLADDYKGAISVDSLLQIHALHNLLEMLQSHGSEIDPSRKPPATQVREYEERCMQLECRYIEQYASKVRAIETTLRPATEKVEELVTGGTGAALLHPDGNWWRVLFASFEEHPQRHSALLLRLLQEQSNMKTTGVCSWPTMDLWLTTWLDKVIERRRVLKEGFHSLAFFVDNLQPNPSWTPETRGNIERLVQTASACHLNTTLFEVDENGERREERLLTEDRSSDSTCLLCSVKNTLNQLEAVLFLIKQTQANTGGLWQVSVHEQVLKQIHQHARRHSSLDTVAVAEGENFLTYLERVKVEFKEFSRFWVEINYTVAAYDELTMCKSRFQLLSDGEYFSLLQTKKKRSQLQLLDFEIPRTLADLQLTKATAEREFVRAKGTLKYLEHLGVRKDIDPCPICQTVPEGKYAVLLCGHHICSICAVKFIKFARSNGNMTSCVICRHEQHAEDIQYVTLTPTTAHNVVRGSYSNKFVKIIETVLELKTEEPDVKIVIFSHWEPILNELGVALEGNGITFRQKSAKFYRSVAEFKDHKQGVTCLLLPLCYGSKGLNLTEATHVFLVEPILNPGEELQAIGRVHRIGQTRPTFVHRFIVLDTIEETIHETIQQDCSGRWLTKAVTVEQLEQLFRLNESQTAMIVL